MEAIKTLVTNTPAEGEVKGKAVKKSGKRIGYNYIILKSLKESQKNDVVTCLYIKSLTNFGICVIKEGTYGDSKDKQGRDIKDRLMWQKQLHESLQDKVRLPRLLGSFEENGNYYLVLERIKGKSLYKACKEAGKELREGLITGNKLGMKFLGYMIQMIELLETLHKNGIVHRDVTATNFMITPAGKVAVIDMELSYSLETQFPSPPFQLGTYGYMSPEQERMEMPAMDQDVFSVGAILLQMWTGASTNKLTYGTTDELSRKVHLMIPDKIFADLVFKCLHNRPELRPTLKELLREINLYKQELKTKKNRKRNELEKYSRNEVLDLAQSVIGTLSSPLMTDEEKGWFSENTSAPPNSDKKKINKGWYASFHKGAVGIIYLLSKAHFMGMDVRATMPFVEKGLDLVNVKYMERLQEVSPALHFGGSGIAAALATAIREGLIVPQSQYFDWINQLLEKENNLLGFQNGIAGQGMAHLLCHPFLHTGKMQAKMKQYANHLINSQQKDGSWIRSIKEKKNRTSKGFAHGVSGIVYFLIEYASIYNDKQAMASAQSGLQWLMKKAVHEKNAITWMSSADKKVAPWWCEGAAGIALTFIKAYSISPDPRYKEFATGALYNHNSQVVDNNLSQCHGLSGLGEIYLEAMRVFQDEEWQERADWILNLIMSMKRNDELHGPYWLVENERQPVADFMIGNSGIIHYLLRCCFPSKIGFPLLK